MDLQNERIDPFILPTVLRSALREHPEQSGGLDHLRLRAVQVTS
jgi:hypothetical protein